MILSAASAVAVLVIVLLTMERLIPGFVAPFVDLADAGLWIGVLCAAAALWGPASRARWVTLPLCAMAGAGGGLFLWSRVNDQGFSGLMLVGAFVLALLLGLFALSTSRED